MAILLVAAAGYAAKGPAAGSAAAIHTGPVYTRGSEAGLYPQFPDVQIQVEVPPSTDAQTLAPNTFQATADDGAAVPASRVQSLAETGYGVAASVALDVSGSMKGAPLNAVRNGLSKFVNDAGPQDKIAIETIADESKWDAEWTDSRDQVRGALVNLATRGKLTRLWDGLLEAIQHFPDTPLSRRLIVISDGHDEGSSHSLGDVIAAAQQHGIVVDAIGITRSNPRYLQGLEQLAGETGGLYRRAKDTQELEQLVSSGIQRLKSIPVVSFRFDALPADGKSHRFAVTWIHEGVESKSEVLAVVPAMAAKSTRDRWMWAAGSATLLGLIVLIVLVARRRSKPLAATAQAASAVSASVPPPPPPPASAVSAPSNIASPAKEPALKPRKVPAAVDEPVARPSRTKTEMFVRFPEPSKGHPSGWLVCEEGFAPGEKFAVDEVEYWIGSLDSNHLQISDDPTVSGNHACLVFDHDVLRIHDYQSTNGTRVNGEVVQGTQRLLRPGDRIKIGRSTFALQPADSGAPV
jgi:Mg-chelatase subunit ChlD